jgi:hypothetical protein
MTNQFISGYRRELKKLPHLLLNYQVEDKPTAILNVVSYTDKYIVEHSSKVSMTMEEREDYVEVVAPSRTALTVKGMKVQYRELLNELRQVTS